MRLSLALALVACLSSLGACDYQVSTRSDFSRDVPLPDAGAGAPAWRATALTLAQPEGLRSFQSVLIDPAIEGFGLNLVLQRIDGSLRVGTAARTGSEQYTYRADRPPAVALATESAGRIEAAQPLAFQLVITSPYGVDLPLADVHIGATILDDGRRLGEGTATGTITGEAASLVRVDLQQDGNPANDIPLTVFLGTATGDLDGDGVLDDYPFSASFEAGPVTVSE